MEGTADGEGVGTTSPAPLDDAARESAKRARVEQRKEKKKKKKRKTCPVSVTVAAGESGVRLRELQGCVVHKLCMGTPSKSVVVNGIIERVVLIQVDGLGPTAYLKHSEELRTLSAFPMAHQLKLPGTNAFVNNPATNLLSSPLTKAQKLAARKAAEDRTTTFESLMLTDEQLAVNEYPLRPTDSDPQSGYIELGPVPVSDETGNRVVAIDCEMVKTSAADSATELARVTVVGVDGKVMLDELVKPAAPVVDYLTEWSGITEPMLADVTTTLADVHAKLLALLGSESIVVGHSLENDLRALKLRHGRIVDSAVCYQGGSTEYRKSALRTLAHQHLKREIQTSATGHDSAEDATAAMDLVLALIKKPGMLAADGQQKQDESICSRLQRHGKESLLLGSSYDVSSHTGTGGVVRVTESDEHAVAQCVHAIEQGKAAPHLIWVQLTAIKGAVADQTPEMVAALEQRVARIAQALEATFPDGGSLLGVVGVPDKAAVFAKNRERAEAKRNNTGAWSKADFDELTILVATARQGLLFLKGI